jgi:hypothetical protein
MRRQTASPIPGALDLVVRAREHAEYAASLVRADADSVVAHRHHPLLAVLQRRERDPQGRVRSEFQRVRE